MTCIQFIPPANNERGPAHLQNLVEGWIAIAGKQGIRLGIGSEKGELRFLIDAPGKRQRIIAAQLENAYPGGKAIVTPPTDRLKHRSTKWLRLTPDVYPLKLHGDFGDKQSSASIDPLEGLFEMIKSGRSGRTATQMWLELKPLKKKQYDRAKKNASYLDGQFRLKLLESFFDRNFSNSKFHSRLMQQIIRAASSPNSGIPEEVSQKLNEHLFSVSLSIQVETDTHNPALHDRKTNDIQSSLCHLLGPCGIFLVETRFRGSFLLSASEIATMWHIPKVDSEVPRVAKNSFVELEPPPNLPRPSKDKNVVALGRVCYRNERYRFGMDIEARRRHLWILGKTGMGKTTLLQSIIKQDLEAGRGFAVLEPHGDLAEGSLKYVPKRRKNDVIYFDPADENCKITFNPLQVPDGTDKILVADAVLTAFQKIFGLDESQAPRLLHIFRNCLLSLVEMPNSTLLDVQRLLVEPLFRKSVIARVENPVVRSFWQDEFNKWKPHDRTAFVASLQNKIGAFLSNPKLQRILGDPKSKLDFRQAMDDGKVLIVNLSKGRLGENASNLLGTLIVTSLQLAAMSRANIPEHERPDFSIIMDEFQNFTSPSIATFLSEARKYRTHLIVANQYAAQLPADIFNAVVGNVANQLLFQIGNQDEPFFGSALQNDLASLTATPRYKAYCKLLIPAEDASWFTMQGFRV